MNVSQCLFAILQLFILQIILTKNGNMLVSVHHSGQDFYINDDNAGIN